MRSSRVALAAAGVCLAACGWAAGCGSSDDSVFDTREAGHDDGSNVDASMPGDDASFNLDAVTPEAETGLGTCDAGCAVGARCKYDVCVPDLGTCRTNDDCPGDSYCDTDKTCVPYGVPPGKINDPTCARPIVPGGVVPTVQCEWTGPAALPDGG